MKPFPLDDLPERSEWAAYLLDPDRDPPGEPTAYNGTETYDRLYRQLLESCRERPLPERDTVRRIRSVGRSNPDLLSRDERLFLATPEELVDREYDVVQTALEPVIEGDETILDLGCGWGWTLDAIASNFSTVRVVGGEYTSAGVELARELVADGTDRITAEPFDFLGEWELVDDIDGDCVIFTKGALVTLSETESVIGRFEALAAEGTATTGVHLEQVGPHPETVLGLLRRRYTRVRRYDDTLLTRLRESPAIEVTDVTYDVHGANPLHPLTRIRWRAR
ncbi:class I SAM-dependent methyltransferase [Halovivax gelatinilyticus]|uniref:class I SAM-dependent methyltransferase n=1 Tax=Halovivax gelatinilyticus TaxID=2961597 RepID=UPI0020CA36F7|nr:class I SAM-dependent methyltransferase [Halovivax gelatinilyticus]